MRFENVKPILLIKMDFNIPLALLLDSATY